MRYRVEKDVTNDLRYGNSSLGVTEKHILQTLICRIPH